MNKNKQTNKELEKSKLDKVQGGFPLPKGSKCSGPKVKETGLKVEFAPQQIENKDDEDKIKDAAVWIGK